MYAIEATKKKNPTGDYFKGFLLSNPQLSDTGLFLQYSSKELKLEQSRVETKSGPSRQKKKKNTATELPWTSPANAITEGQQSRRFGPQTT
jgi:hypothetical protein